MIVLDQNIGLKKIRLKKTMLFDPISPIIIFKLLINRERKSVQYLKQLSNSLMQKFLLCLSIKFVVSEYSQNY
jgi:hypothetical protein